MSWVTVIWSAESGCCLLLALMYLFVWSGDRRSWQHLCFPVSALGVIGLAACEMTLMHAETPSQYEWGFRWGHAAALFVVLGSLGFVHFYFGTGQRWLLALAVGSRLLAVVLNFTTGSSLHFLAIHSLQRVSFLGEQVSVVGEWTRNPWVIVGQFASVTQVVYVVDASFRLWRSSEPRARLRVGIVGGSLALFMLAATAQAGMVSSGWQRIPPIISLPFLAIMLAMAYEMSRGVLQAGKLARELSESEGHFRLVFQAAPNAMLLVDPGGRIVLANAQTEAVFGYSSVELVGEGVERLFPDNHHATLWQSYLSQPIARPMGTGRELAGRRKDGTEVPVEFGLNPFHTSEGQFVLASIIDITMRKLAEAEAARHQRELAHLARVSILGELAGALAHELNQPLAAMLSNSQAGQRFLRQGMQDADSMRAILGDITDDAKRARDIIQGLRAMLKKDVEVQPQPVNVNDAVTNALVLLHSEIVSRKVFADLHLDESLPAAMAGHVGVQQVLINLILNSLDAMKSQPQPGGKVRIATVRKESQVIITVHDTGPGIPLEIMNQLFEPFFSTKTDGLGLGLAISRRIVIRFGGELSAENHPKGGAIFRMALPVALGV